MTKCYQNAIPFSPFNRRQIAASFNGGEITSNAGLLLLRQIIKNTGLAKKASACLIDDRRQASIQHHTETLIAAVVVSNTRRIQFLLSSSCPDEGLFRIAAARLKPG